MTAYEQQKADLGIASPVVVDIYEPPTTPYRGRRVARTGFHSGLGESRSRYKTWLADLLKRWPRAMSRAKWLTHEANRIGTTKATIQHRYRRGVYTKLEIESYNSRIVFVLNP